jgi:DNA polymerase-3 subunit gamma/tau
MASRSIAFDVALQELASVLHRIALVQTVPSALAEDDPHAAALLQLAQLLTAEDVQLYYQITIHGRAEIDLAPDEYAGFSMTLLRMLAFAPSKGQVGNSAPVAKTAAASVAPVVAMVAQPAAVYEVAEVPAVRQPVATSQPKTIPLALAAGELPDWANLLAQLNLQGLAGQLAKNCVLESLEGERLVLSLSVENKGLQNNKVAFERLQAVLSEYFAKPMKVQIVLGQNVAATPAIVEQQAKSDRQQQANQAIASDDFGIAAQAELGAQLLSDSIRAI